MTKKSLKIHKQNITLYYKSILTFDLPVLYSPHEDMNLYIFQAFLPPGSGSASVHADKGRLFKCGSGYATLTKTF